MTVADMNLSKRPSWQRKTRSRLAASIALAALLIATTVVVVRFEVEIEVEELVQLEVQLLSPETAVAPEPTAESEPEEIPAEQPDEPVRPLDAAVERASVSEETAPQTDWRSQIADVVKAAVAEQGRGFSVNPAFDEKRRQAAARYAPSRAPQKKPIWENVEVDQLGRKILVSGDCHRVLDDPSAVNNEIFRTYQQYIVYCTKQKSAPAELPWTEEIRDRYDYLAQRGDLAGSDKANVLANLR